MSRATSRSRWAAVRDLAVISLAVVVLLWFGTTTEAFDRLRRWIGDRWQGRTGDVLIGIALATAGALAFALLRWRADAREARARREAEARFQRLVEQMPSVTYTWNPSANDPRSWYVSPQIRTVLGLDPALWVADPTRRVSYVHEDDRERVLEAFQRGLRTGDAITVEYRFVRADGDIVWIREDVLAVERDEHRRPTLVQGVLLDVTERRRAEQQLAETEGRYRTLVERVPAVTYVWDASHHSGDAPAMYISPQVRHLLGYGPEAFEDPLLWTRLVHPDDLERVLAEWAACERGDVAFRSEYRMRANDGRTVWIRDEAVPVSRDDRGHVTFQGVMFDITDRKDAEDRLRAAETRYRSLVEHMPVVAYLTDTTTEPPERYIAPGIRDLVGYTQGEWIANTNLWSSILHPDDRGRVLSGWEIANRDRGPFRAEYRLVARDGRTVWVLDDARIVERDEDGGSVWQGVLVDVTARVEAEERVRDAERTYRTLVEQLPVAVYQDALDEQSTAVYISPQYERLFGYSPEERLNDGGLWVRSLHPDDRERVLAESDRTNRTGDPFVAEYRFQTRDGRYVWVRDEATLLRNDDGTPKVWQGVLIDIDERKRAEETLSRRDAILDAVGFAAERFLKSSDPDATLPSVLEHLGQAAGVSRAYVFRNETLGDGTLAMTVQSEWAAEGVASIDEPSNRGLSYEAGFSRWRERLAAGRDVHGLTRGFPDGERRALQAEAVRSLAIVPVFVGEAWWGFLGFDDCVEERLWSSAEIEALRAAADTLGAAIGRADAEARRRDAEERYRTLVETIPAVTYMQGAGEGDRTYYVSPQIERMLGYSPEEWALSLDDWLDTVHPDDRERVRDADRRSEATGEPFLVEYRQRHGDGRYVWVRDESVLVRDARGMPLFWQGLLFDITAEREAEQQIRDAEHRYRALVEHIPAVLYIDPIREEDATIYVSPRVEEILGITQDEYINEVNRWRALIHPDDRDWVFEAYRRSVDEREGWAVEYRVTRPDGRTIWLRDESVVLPDADGQPYLFQGVMYDITERKQAEVALRLSERHEREAAERLRTLDEMKNTFLAAVSHELRSPLTSILGLALTLEQQSLDPDDARDLTGRLAQNARKLDRLLRDLLDIDRLSRGIVTPLRHATDVGELARRTVESLDLPASREIRVETDEVVLEIDAAKVERIVENLVMNAMRHTDDGASIWIRVRAEDGGALIVVEDDGPGVPEALREAIFEPFQQGPSRSRHSPGTGIGLSLVAMFTDLHGGRAWVEDRDGGGASFRVFLPADGAAEGHDRDDRLRGGGRVGDDVPADLGHAAAH